MEQEADSEISLLISMDEISGPRLSKYKHSYSQLNRNERGVITIKELGAMIRTLGENPTDKELEDIFKTSDVDGNGEIDLRDYCFVMARFENQEECEMCQLFKTFDRDCDGFITESKLLKLIQTADFQADKKIIMHMLRERHSKGDGWISFTEFMDMIRKTFA